MSDFGNIIKRGREASKPVGQDAGMPALQNDGSPASQPDDDPTVSLTIKVRKSLRKHWTIAAKQHDTSVAAAIVEALTERFGTP